MKERKFKPKDGQVDYTNVRYAPVINCILRCKDKILLVKRSEGMRLYPGYWNGISGFLDDNRTIEEKVKDELKEELRVSEDRIVSISHGGVYETEDKSVGKVWIVHPVLVDVSTNAVTLDWEAEKYIWIEPSQIETLKLLPGFDRVLKSLI